MAPCTQVPDPLKQAILGLLSGPRYRAAKLARYLVRVTLTGRDVWVMIQCGPSDRQYSVSLQESRSDHYTIWGSDPATHIRSASLQTVMERFEQDLQAYLSNLP